MQRREFVRGILEGTVGLAALPLVPRVSRSLGGPAAALPPRVVGARTRAGDFVFDPPGLGIQPGETVVWLNMGDFHTATAFHPRYAELLSDEVPLGIPERAEPFHSGMLGLEETVFEHRFQVPGVYDYFCQPHYAFGMVGRLVVGREADGPGARSDSELPAAVRASLPPWEVIVGPAGRTWEWAARINGVLLLRTRGTEAAPAAQSVREGVLSDSTATNLLRKAGVRNAFAERLGPFVRAAGEGSYEALTEHADVLKGFLDQARDAA